VAMPQLPTWREQARLQCAPAIKGVSQYSRYGQVLCCNVCYDQSASCTGCYHGKSACEGVLLLASPHAHTCMSFLEAAADEPPSSLSHPENHVGYGIVVSRAAASAAAHDATPARKADTCEPQPGGPTHGRIKVRSGPKRTVTITLPDRRKKAAKTRRMSICTIMARLRLYDQLLQLQDRNRSTTVSIATVKPPHAVTGRMMNHTIALHCVC
jgi:hypothetical protein